ncbi:MAG: hypothetical protein AAF974_10620 [Cyanobacteria bacterium P01_E01_bin.34]
MSVAHPQNAVKDTVTSLISLAVGIRSRALPLLAEERFSIFMFWFGQLSE